MINAGVKLSIGNCFISKIRNPVIKRITPPHPIKSFKTIGVDTKGIRKLARL